MKRRFDKMHGLGNDFVVIDARESPLALSSTMARSIADRRTGIGCDQLIVLEPSETADLLMRIWNNDGTEAAACGNAARCVVQLTGARTIESAGGLLGGTDLGSDIEIVLPEPRFAWDEIPLAYPMDTSSLPMAWDELGNPFAVNVGNPHVVFFVADVANVALKRLGRIIERDPVFPDRINVNVATLSKDHARLRTFERGAGETRACGTGACATAVAAISLRRAQSPLVIEMSGGSLTIDWHPGEPIRMRGTASHVFAGELELGALK